MSNFAGIKRQGPGRVWDWQYPLTNVSNVIRDAMRIIFQEKINTFQADSSTHNASDVLLYCAEQFKEAEILLTSSFDYSTKLYLKEEAILTNPEFLLNALHFCLETSITMTTELKLINALQN